MSASGINQLISANAVEIKRLHDRLHETAKRRSKSPQDRAEWEAACAEFHRRYDALAFPGGYETALTGLATGNQQVIEATLSFLEVRPYFFRSGYMRKVLLRKIKKADLTPYQLVRLGDVLVRQAKWETQKEKRRNN